MRVSTIIPLVLDLFTLQPTVLPCSQALFASFVETYILAALLQELATESFQRHDVADPEVPETSTAQKSREHEI